MELCPGTHSVFGVEVGLTSDEVLCALVVAGPHGHVQRCAEQLGNLRMQLICRARGQRLSQTPRHARGTGGHYGAPHSMSSNGEVALGEEGGGEEEAGERGEEAGEEGRRGEERRGEIPYPEH